MRVGGIFILATSELSSGHSSVTGRMRTPSLAVAGYVHGSLTLSTLLAGQGHSRGRAGDSS